jgi:hypothetical protein
MNARLWSDFARTINYLFDECEKEIDQANVEIENESTVDSDWTYYWTDVMGESEDGSAQKTNAELKIMLAEETIVFCEELINSVVSILGNNPDSRLLPDVYTDVYTTLKKHLDNLTSEYSKIPKNTGWDVRTNDVNDIRRYWIEKKMKMVNELLQKMSAIELDDFVSTKPSETPSELEERERQKRIAASKGFTAGKRGRRRKRSGRKCKRTIGKKRKCITRRRLRRR